MEIKIRTVALLSIKKDYKNLYRKAPKRALKKIVKQVVMTVIERFHAVRGQTHMPIRPTSEKPKKREAFEEMEESDGERDVGSDTTEGTEERAIRTMPIVTTLSFVRAVKDGVRVTLTCYNCREYGCCEKPQ